MIWLLGSGPMAIEYAKVLTGLKVDFTVIGRGAASAESFEQATGTSAFVGGLEAYLKTNPAKPAHVIVATSVETLAPVSLALLRYGAPSLLLEKPAGLTTEEIREVEELSRSNGATVLVAYNRRFFASVLNAQEIAAADGGVTSFNFEFTEWGHVIAKAKKSDEVLNAWLLANSTHVLDLAFHLGGSPVSGACFASGADRLAWHPKASAFSGAGVSDQGALYSYQANWQAPGRWGVEILTKESRLILRPMEQLHIQKIGSVAIEKVELEDSLDAEFKPGLYRQVQSYLASEHDNFCTIKDQVAMSELCTLVTSGWAITN